MIIDTLFSVYLKKKDKMRKIDKDHVEHIITEYRYRIDYYVPVETINGENLKLFDSNGVLIEEFCLPDDSAEVVIVLKSLKSFLDHKRKKNKKENIKKIFVWVGKSVIVPIVVTIITTWILKKYFTP